jgi:hypothetical protein
VQGIQAAIAQALFEFDRQGQDGVVKRSQFISNSHLVGHRINAMIASISGKSFTPVFGTGASGLGIYAR